MALVNATVPGGGGGAGTVTSVTAADGSVVVAGTAANPTVRTGTVDAVAAAHPAAADWSNNSHKITSLANGAAASDAAAFGQIPTALPPNGAASGDLTGTYPGPTVAAGKITEAKLSLSDVTTADVSTTAHGFAPKAPNVATQFLNGVGAWSTPSSSNTIGYSTRAANTILAGADSAKVIDATAAFTQTFTAAATLGAGWWVIYRNSTADGTTLVVLDPNGAETIDGLTTATLYSGEARMITCDGSAFHTVLLEGGFAKFTPTGGTFVVPAGIQQASVVCVGGGGQGGGGASSVSTAKSGGGGGGGASVTQALLRAGDLGAAGSSVTVTVGAGGSAAGGGGGAGAGATGTDGSDGGATSFGTLLAAYGGGGGKGGTNAVVAGGGGASVVASGVNSSAGQPNSTTAIGGQGSTALGGSTGNSGEWGGGSGGGAATGSAPPGGSSIFAGPGGGAGGQVSAGNAGATGGIGGKSQSYTAGGGGAAGTGGATPTAGTAGATFAGPYCGTAGGGGGGGTAVAGKNGGAGGIGAGGGGGGASSSATSSLAGGNGGNGGAGECRVWFT